MKILQTSVQDALKDGAPNGVDCFFDNVGGEDAAVIINSMNEFGRVSCCGAISVYNESEKALPKISTTSQTIVFRVCIFHLDSKFKYIIHVKLNKKKYFFQKMIRANKKWAINKLILQLLNDLAPRYSHFLLSLFIVL